MNWVWFWWAIFALFFVNLAWRVSKLPRERRLKVATRELLIILLCYAGMVAMLMFLERRLIFVPSTAAEDWEEPHGLTFENVRFEVRAAGEPMTCHGWWCPQPKAAATLLYCHGNAGNLSGRAAAIPDWQSLGLNVFIFDYPGYGRSGGEPTEASCLASGQAAYAWLTKTKGVPPEQIILYGKSLGGAIALDLALQQPHRALVLYEAFTSIPDMAQKMLPFFPSRLLVRTQFDNLAKMKDYRGALFIGHGEADTLVPPEHADRLFAAASACSFKRLKKYPGAPHGGPPGAFMADVAAFLKELPAPSVPNPAK